MLNHPSCNQKRKCTILSLNVRGLRDNVKRRSIFSFLKDQKAKFYFLQETFSDANDEAIWKNEWGGEIVLSHGRHHSKGVCILIDPSQQVKVDFSNSLESQNHLRWCKYSCS